MRTVRLAVATAAIAVFSSSVSVEAQVAAYGGILQNGQPPQTINAPGTYSTSTANVTLSLAPTVTVSASTTAPSYGNAQTDDYIDYYFSAVGADNTWVPVSITYNIQTGASGWDSINSAGIETHIYDANGNELPWQEEDIVACSTTGYSPCSEKTWYNGFSSVTNGVLTGYVRSNTPTWIGLDATSFSANEGEAGQASSGFAVVDPEITILDPNFTLGLPDGVGNLTGLGSIVGSVPEPSTWALILLGFGGIGLLLRSRQAPVARGNGVRQ